MKEIHPKDLLKNLHIDGELRRWDLIAAYVFVKDYLEKGFKNKIYDYISYKKWLHINKTRNIANYSIYDLVCQRQMFFSLILNINKNGFNPDNPIILTENGMIFDGLHRSAVMLYFDRKIPYVVRECGSGIGFDINWYEKNILDKYVKRIKQEYSLIMEDV